MFPGRSAAAFARTVLTQDRIFAGLRRVLPHLLDAGVEPIPLKGVLLAWTIYGAPEQRPVSDADLLVRPEHFQRATAVLAELGGRVVPRSGVLKHCIEFHAGRTWWTVDLHCELWPRGFVQLDLEDAWEHASTWESPFGVTLAVPPRRFTFSHVACHFARNAFIADDRACEDIERAVEWALAEESPESLSSYLARCRASAAAYYALSAAARSGAHPSVTRLLAEIHVPAARAAALRALTRGPRIPPRLLRPFLAVP